MARKRKTAGELSLKAASDNSKYDPLEIAYALTDDVINQLKICAARHDAIFDEPEYFLSLNIASDPLIKGIRRHKYAAFLYMPSPRPEQSVYLYKKATQSIKRLWSLPNAYNMAYLSELKSVEPEWAQTKIWCDAFFRLKFWETIRSQHGISHLSEHEYLNANREKFVKAGCKEAQASCPDTFDFSKVSAYKVVDSNETSGS